MFNEIIKYANKPLIYAPSTKSLWDDEHISKEMLEAHLNPILDAASRNHDFIDSSAKWISEVAPPSQYKHLLDLGCGPGLYTERFNHAGYTVTGMDISKRSIEYAKEQALLGNSNIKYQCQNYLEIDYADQFDLITLIYCDYAALSTTNRLILSEKIYRALKPKGRFIVDVFSPKMKKSEKRSWYYSDKAGFFSGKPHICMESVYQYDDDTQLEQYIILTDEGADCYNIWNRFFTKESFIDEVESIGFKLFGVFGDAAGKEFSETRETICGVFEKCR